MGKREHRERTRKYDIKCTQTGGDCSFIPPKEPPKTDVNSLKVTERLGVIQHTCNPSIWEAETRKLPRLGSQPGLKNENLSQKQNRMLERNELCKAAVSKMGRWP